MFSPYYWRVSMALAHKGLEVESIPWHFSEKEAISFSGQVRVSALVDGKMLFQIHGKLQNIWKLNILIHLH